MPKESLEDAVRHVLKHGKIGCRSKQRLKAALEGKSYEHNPDRGNK